MKQVHEESWVVRTVWLDEFQHWPPLNTNNMERNSITIGIALQEE